MSREPVTVDSMIEHIDGFAELVERIDHVWSQVYGVKKVVASDRARFREELQAVDGHLSGIYEGLAEIAGQLKPLIEAKNRLDTVLQQLGDMAGTQAKLAGHVAHLRATPLFPSMKRLEKTQQEVGATLKPGDGLLMIMDGNEITISLEELSIFLGLTEWLYMTPEERREWEKHQ